MTFKVLYDKDHRDTQIPVQDNSVLQNVTIDDLKALQGLMELWDESNPEEEDWTFNAPRMGCSASSHSSHIPVFNLPKSYKPKSKCFSILQGIPNIWAFVIQVTKEIEITNWRLGPNPKLAFHLKRALKSLKTNKNIIVKPSDKGENLVITDTESCESICYDIIRNTKWYRTVPMSHVEYYIKQYRDILIRAHYK